MATKKEEKRTTSTEVQSNEADNYLLDDFKLNRVREGCEVRIKEGVKVFIDGYGVHAILPNRKLYVRGISRNGIVTIGYAPDAGTIGSLLPDEVEFVAPPRDSSKTIPSKPSDLIDVRIIGVPERMDTILYLKELLSIPDDRVFIDEDHEGLHFNAQRAWRYPTDKKFVMVIQDDIDVCDEFLKYCEYAAKSHPDDIISLFPFHYTESSNINKTNKIYSMPSPYVSTPDTSGQAIIMKAEYVKDCMDSWTNEMVGDDVSISLWATNNNIRMITTLPSMVQHLGQLSVLDPSRSFGRTPFFQKDVSEFNWKNKTVIDRKWLLK